MRRGGLLLVGGDFVLPLIRCYNRSTRVGDHKTNELLILFAPGLCGHMSEDDESRSDVIRRLFYLITVAAEDAAATGAEGQSRALPSDMQAAAVQLRARGETIEILASAIEILVPSEVGRQPDQP